MHETLKKKPTKNKIRARSLALPSPPPKYLGLLGFLVPLSLRKVSKKELVLGMKEHIRRLKLQR